MSLDEAKTKKLDEIIAKLLAARDKKPGTTVNLSSDEIFMLIDESTKVGPYEEDRVQSD